MRKENLVSAKVGGLNGCITRARASALRASGQKVPLKALSQQAPKMRRNTGKAALDESKANAKSNPCLQQKKRAVLQDVTNVLCETSYKNCFNAAKIEVHFLSRILEKNLVWWTLLIIFALKNHGII